MTKKSEKKTTVWRDYGPCDGMTTGATTRTITEIILYDENGPIITNYTNSNNYEFETIRPISVKAVNHPDWTNEAGFIIKEHDSYHARYESGAFYVLFINIDNLKPYARQLSEYWALYMPTINAEAGALQCEFSYEGCTFNRIVGNWRTREALDAISAIHDQYEGHCTYFNNVYHVASETAEAKAACDHLKGAIEHFEAVVKDIRDNYGIMELIRENGADGPINHNDYNDVTRQHEWLKNTYRIECYPN